MTIQELAAQSAHITHVYQVTEEVYDHFQRCSLDYNPLHTDPVYANSKGFMGIGIDEAKKVLPKPRKFGSKKR